MSPRTLTATLLLLLTMDTMQALARPPPHAAPNATDVAPDAADFRLLVGAVHANQRIAVGANQHFGGAAPRPLLHRLRQLGNASEAAAEASTPDEDDSTVRNERSTNLSHITGTSRKIQMYIKNRHLQMMPDGTVNGTNDDTSDYTIFQRTSVNLGELKIQSVATCLYLCMDVCGLLYGALQFTEECIFRETIELDHYNTYTSVRFSDSKKTLYMGLDGRGSPRRVQVLTLRQKRQFQLPEAAKKSGGKLGRLATYARVLTRHVPNSRVEELARRVLLERQRLEVGTTTGGGGGGGGEEVALRHHGFAHLCPAHSGLVTLPPPRVTKKCTGRMGAGGGGGGGKRKTTTPAPKKQPPKRKKCSEEEDIEKCKRERKLHQQKLKQRKKQQTGPQKGKNGPKGPKGAKQGPQQGPRGRKGPQKKGPAARTVKQKNKKSGAGGKRTTTSAPPTLFLPPTPFTASTAVPTLATAVVPPTPSLTTNGSD